MRLFKDFKHTNEITDTTELYLDENNEFKELKSLGYELHLTTEEHKKAIRLIDVFIIRALHHGINVYYGYEKANRFSLIEKELVTSTDSIIAFSTSDENKYETLENIVKDLIKDMK